jgi:hypothetical protein
MSFWRIAITLLFSLALQAADLSAEKSAKILKSIANGCGEFQISCKEPGLKAALSALGISVEDGSSIVWCSTAMEAKAQLQLGRLVVVGNRDLASSACVVIVEEGGRPKIIFNMANLRVCKVKLGDALMKIGEKG